MSRPAPAPARDLLLAPIEPAGAVEQVVRRIGEAIGAGVLAPGERLPGQVELAETLGAARGAGRAGARRRAPAPRAPPGAGRRAGGAPPRPRPGGAFVAASPPPP